MAKDIIGNANGMNFFVGSDKPAMANAQTPTTIVQPATQNTQTPVVTAPSLTTSINVPKTVPTQALTANVTNFDLNKTLAQNQQVRNQFLQALNNTSDLDKARQQNTDAYNTLQNFDVSVEGGLQKIMNKPIALDFQQGQQAALTRDAAFTRSSLARAYEATGLNLQNVTQARNDILERYKQLMAFGQEDVNTGFKLDALRREDEALKKEQEMNAKQFAYDNSVTKPFYLVGGTIYRSSDGKAYSTPEEYIADGGSKNFSDVQKVDAQVNQEKGMVFTLASKYLDAGILPTDDYQTAVQKVMKSTSYIQENTPARRGGGSGGGGSRSTSKNSSEPEVPTVDSETAIRHYLQSMDRAFGNDNNYYDIWGVAAEALRANNIDPSKYDKTFWDIFRPGEWEKNHK